MAKRERTSLWDPVTAEDRKKLDELLKPLENFTEQDVKEQIEKLEQETKQYNEDLRARAKTPEQLTEGLKCTVLEVNEYQDSTHVYGEWRSGPMRITNTGNTYHTEIRVKNGTLVEKLKFNGWPSLEKGDTIRAYILKGQEEAEKLHFEFKDPYQDAKTHLVERDYQAVERPSKIEKLRDGKVVATYHNQ